MKICVYGCGAIGGLLAARLAAAGNDVSVIARGAQLQAIQSNGLTLLSATVAEPLQVAVTASEQPADLGAQDLVLLTMKAHAVPAVAEAVAPLLGANTLVVTATNGIPWWYFHGLGDTNSPPEIHSVDPGRKLWRAIGPQRALGCVVYPAAVVEAPGVVRHVFGERFSLGEPDGSVSERSQQLAAVLQVAGFQAPLTQDIRAELWTKLVANAAYNPVSVMTGKTLGEMIDDAATCALLRKIMTEVVAVAASYDVSVTMNPDELLAATRQLGGHKTSMLQDLQAGRSLELEPIVGAVLELARLRGINLPGLTMAYDLTRSRQAQQQQQ